MFEYKLITNVQRKALIPQNARQWLPELQNCVPDVLSSKR